MTGTNQTPASADLSDIIREEDERKADLGQQTAMLVVAAALGLIANWVATGINPFEVASVLGFILAKLVPFRLPAVAWVSLPAILITIPGFPGAAFVVQEVEKLNFLALAMPALAYGGLALTQKEFTIARQSGWKIVIVAICVMLGTYMGSIIIADLTLKITG